MNHHARAFEARLREQAGTDARFRLALSNVVVHGEVGTRPPGFPSSANKNGSQGILEPRYPTMAEIAGSRSLEAPASGDPVQSWWKTPAERARHPERGRSGAPFLTSPVAFLT